jgi:hypothetical protein
MLAAGVAVTVVAAIACAYPAVLNLTHDQISSRSRRKAARAGVVDGPAGLSARRGLKLVEGFRWRFVPRPAFGPRFLLNDRGWCSVGQQNRPGRGLWVPLSAEVELLAWLQRGVAGAFDHLTLWPGWATWLNTATWVEAPSFVAGHPDDGRVLDELTHVDDVASQLERFGPY